MTGRALEWKGQDEGTPWLELRVLLSQGTTRRQLRLGHRPLAGRIALRVPAGTWRGVLAATSALIVMGFLSMGFFASMGGLVIAWAVAFMAGTGAAAIVELLAPLVGTKHHYISGGPAMLAQEGFEAADIASARRTAHRRRGKATSAKAPGWRDRP